MNCGYHPSSGDMPEQLCCLLEHEWSCVTNSLWKLGLQILMPVVLENLCENASPPLTISSLSKLPYSMPPAFCWGICLNDHMGFSLLNFPRIAKFQVFHPPKGFLSRKIPQCHMTTCRILFSTELIFAPVEDTETGFKLVKWPGQLMTTGQLTLWDLRLKFLVAWKSPDIVETHVLIFFWKSKSHFLCIYY